METAGSANRTRLPEYIFFFGLLAVSAYVMWHIIAPFIGALAVAGVVATAGYPFHRRVLAHTPRQSNGLAALLTTLLIGLLVVIPLTGLAYLLFAEALSLYHALGGGGLSVGRGVGQVENLVRQIAPAFTFDASAYARAAALWLAEHIGGIFAATTATLFFIFTAAIAVFYCFRDGEAFVRYLIQLSPLPDDEDAHILKALARSVRSVVLGTLAIALIQGTLTAIGFAVFGIANPALWGAVAAVGSLIPSVGTLIVFAPAVAFLTLTGSYGAAIGLAVWGAIAVGLVDNLLGPYLMSRGGALHPFLVLLAVLGGIAVFGPMGFILGPVALSLFSVLLELYIARVRQNGETLTPRPPVYDG